MIGPVLAGLTVGCVAEKPALSPPGPASERPAAALLPDAVVEPRSLFEVETGNDAGAGFSERLGRTWVRPGARPRQERRAHRHAPRRQGRHHAECRQCRNPRRGPARARRCPRRQLHDRSRGHRRDHRPHQPADSSGRRRRHAGLDPLAKRRGTDRCRRLLQDRADRSGRHRRRQTDWSAVVARARRRIGHPGRPPPLCGRCAARQAPRALCHRQWQHPGRCSPATSSFCSAHPTRSPP